MIKKVSCVYFDLRQISVVSSPSGVKKIELNSYEISYCMRETKHLFTSVTDSLVVFQMTVFDIPIMKPINCIIKFSCFAVSLTPEL